MQHLSIFTAFFLCLFLIPPLVFTAVLLHKNPRLNGIVEDQKFANIPRPADPLRWEHALSLQKKETCIS